MLHQSYVSDLNTWWIYGDLQMSFIKKCECDTPHVLQGIRNDIRLLTERGQQQFQISVQHDCYIKLLLRTLLSMYCMTVVKIITLYPYVTWPHVTVVKQESKPDCPYAILKSSLLPRCWVGTLFWIWIQREEGEGASWCVPTWHGRNSAARAIPHSFIVGLIWIAGGGKEGEAIQGGSLNCCPSFPSPSDWCGRREGRNGLREIFRPLLWLSALWSQRDFQPHQNAAWVLINF